MKEHICGIYKIENEIGEVYIGSANAKQGIAKRWANHLSNLRKGIHKYSELQDSWNRDTKNLKWEVLEECLDNISDLELAKKEEYWVKYCNFVDDWNVINKNQNKFRRHTVKDVSKMCVAQSGSSNGNARLVEDDVREIRRLYKDSKYNFRELADLYKVSIGHISNIINYIKWKNLE